IADEHLRRLRAGRKGAPRAEAAAAVADEDRDVVGAGARDEQVRVPVAVEVSGGERLRRPRVPEREADGRPERALGGGRPRGRARRRARAREQQDGRAGQRPSVNTRAKSRANWRKVRGFAFVTSATVVVTAAP